MRSLRAAVNRRTNEVLVNSPIRTDGQNYLMRLCFLEYMADPQSDKTPEGLIELSSIIGVPASELHRWKRSREFQALLARRLREEALGGMGLATAYEFLMKAVSNPELSQKDRAQAARDLAKLSLKRDELYLRYAMHREKQNKQSDRESFEDRVKAIEAEFTVVNE